MTSGHGVIGVWFWLCSAGAVRVLFDCTARGVVLHFLTGFRTEQFALCIWQRTLFSPGRRNPAREADGGL